ncbi:unnamed protein product [Ectocarpus fasciculatus]
MGKDVVFEVSGRHTSRKAVCRLQRSDFWCQTMNERRRVLAQFGVKEGVLIANAGHVNLFGLESIQMGGWNGEGKSCIQM